MADYIKWIRSKVGHDTIILNFSGACITNANGEILLQKRSGDEDVWGLPGGALEIGESAEDAVIREVIEETGLIVKVDYLVGLYSKYFNVYPNGDSAQAICYLFKCNVVSGDLTIDNKETFDLRFFNKDNLPRLFVKQYEDMIDDFFQNKRGVFK